MQKVVFVIVFCFYWSVSLSFSQILPAFGEERVGTSIGAALKIPAAAREAAFNGAFLPIADDATGIFVNPAGMFQAEPLQASFSYGQWLAGMEHQSVSFLYRPFDDNAFGISVVRLGIDPIQVTTETQPYGTGEWFLVEHIHAGITYAHQFTDQFTAGVTINGIYERLGKTTLTGLLFHFGTLYYTGLANTRIALSVANFGAPLRPTGTVPLYPDDSSSTFQSFSPPVLFQFGAATEVLKDSLSRITVALQFDHPSDQAEQYAIGVEVARQFTLAIPFQIQARAGYRINAPLAETAFGTSVLLPFIGASRIRIDYAGIPTDHFGFLHRISVVLQSEGIR